MRHVDHDPAAARVAAHRCREAAAAYLRIADVVGTVPGTVSWWGCERDQVVVAAAELADDLRREAGALEGTADLLEAAARAAERREAEFAAQVRAAAATAGPAPCPVLTSTPSVAQIGRQGATQRARSTTGSVGSTTGRPAGVR